MKMFTYHKTDGLLWFRIFGYGFVAKNVNKHHMIFSERSGYVKYIKIGKYLIKVLKP